MKLAFFIILLLCLLPLYRWLSVLVQGRKCGRKETMSIQYTFEWKNFLFICLTLNSFMNWWERWTSFSCEEKQKPKSFDWIDKFHIKSFDASKIIKQSSMEWDSISHETYVVHLKLSFSIVRAMNPFYLIFQNGRILMNIKLAFPCVRSIRFLHIDTYLWFNIFAFYHRTRTGNADENGISLTAIDFHDSILRELICLKMCCCILIKISIFSSLLQPFFFIFRFTILSSLTSIQNDAVANPYCCMCSFVSKWFVIKYRIYLNELLSVATVDWY